MRILANYGYKTNGDMYSVTFETIRDVPTAQAPQAVDELFRLAREAIQRQIGVSAPTTPPAAGNGSSGTPATPLPASAQPAAAAPSANGKKPVIKDPSRPASPKQLGLLRRLATRTGESLGDLTDLTMGEASKKIEALQNR